MEKEIDKKAQTNWLIAQKALRNYWKYILRKPDRFRLSVIDLLFISNFKGGNGTIAGYETTIEEKLKAYTTQLRAIAKDFDRRKLGELSVEELTELTKLATAFLALCKKEATNISGFKASYASALLHAYFPRLLPILDQRILFGFDLVEEVQYDRGIGQVKDIEKFYPALLMEVHEHCKANSRKTIRAIDEEYFKLKKPDWTKKRNHE